MPRSRWQQRRSLSSPGKMLETVWETATVRTYPALKVRMALVMYAVIFLYAAAFWIQIGVLPFLSKKLGADPLLFGYMETVFAVSMLLGGPLFGRFGDIFGARAALLLAFLSSFLTYLILSLADGIPALFVSRVFAFMMHAMHGAQMVMTDVSGSVDRADALGKLGVAYGVGMVVGPSVGGYVTSMESEQFAAAVAAGLCVLAMAIVIVFVPKSTKDPTKENKDSYNSGGVLNVSAIFSLLSIPAVAFVVVLKTAMGIPAGVFHSMFTIVNIERFELTPETNGHLLSYIGFITMIMQGFIVGYVGKRVSDRTTVTGSIIIVTISYLVLMMTSTLFQLCLVLIPMIMGGALLNTLTNSVITKSVPETATGTSLGLSMATHSLIRTVSPTLGGYVYQWLGYPGFGLLGFVTGAIMTGVVIGKGGVPGT